MQQLQEIITVSRAEEDELTTLGSPMRAMATLRRRFIPPL